MLLFRSSPRFSAAHWLSGWCLLAAFVLVVVSCHDDSDSEEYSYAPMNYLPDLSERYGVRWSITDPNDLGERCFAACYKQAAIGIGSRDGYSDFDSIYPWSDIRRVDIDGDTFVRIPLFCYERYIEDGYEYRVISRAGGAPHPAFVEDGTVVDAIYVGAYECSVSDSTLHSVAGVIPATGYTPAEFLAMARRRGAGYTLYDMRTVDLLFSLFAVEYGCRNSGVVLGYGIAQYLQPLEREYSNSDNFYSTVVDYGVNTFRTKSRGTNKKITVGSNICICRGTQDVVLTFAKVLAISDSKTATTYTFDGPPH